jgi:hypothetical protein
LIRHPATDKCGDEISENWGLPPKRGILVIPFLEVDISIVNKSTEQLSRS